MSALPSSSDQGNGNDLREIDKSHIYVNTVLYIGRFHRTDPDNFTQHMQYYNFDVNSMLVPARKQLIQAYESCNIEIAKKLKDADPKRSDGVIKALKSLLDLCTGRGENEPVFLPHPDENRYVFSCSEARTVKYVTSEAQDLTDRFKNLEDIVKKLQDAVTRHAAPVPMASTAANVQQGGDTTSSSAQVLMAGTAANVPLLQVPGASYRDRVRRTRTNSVVSIR